MSHLHERSEKKCLNCGAELYDRFCHKCGQENVEPKQNFWQLTLHFFEDLTHFDGKFFTTIKYLLFKPGFLTEEYVKGRRASHINPIRMYLFISAAYFLAIMSIFPDNGNSLVELNNTRSANTIDSMTKALQTAGPLSNNDTLSNDSSGSLQVIRNGNNVQIESESDWFDQNTVAEYDSLQNALPKEKRDGWLKHYWKRGFAGAMELHAKDPEEFEHRFREKFYHTLPYMLFLSLPIIALLLQLLYIRRKQFYYVSHIIFMLHSYCFAFILLLLVKSFKTMGSIGTGIALLLLASCFIYLFIAMKRFYKQSYGKTMLKYLLFISSGLTLIGILSLLFLFNSVLSTGV